MRETLKLALRLLIFTVAAGLLLAVTNHVTKGPIADQADSASSISRMAVLPSARSFEKQEILNAESYPDIDGVYIGKDGDEVVGYAFSLSPMGYKDEIVMTLGITSGGAISGLTVESQSETAGLGTRVAEQPYLSQYLGLAASEQAISSGVDAISGATVSSRAVAGAVSQAVKYAGEVLGITGKADRSLAEERVLTGSDIKRMEMLDGGKSIDEITPYSAFGYENIEGIYRVKTSNGDGYVFELLAGSGEGDVLFSISVSESGEVSSVSIDEPADSKALGEDFLSGFTGRPLSEATASGVSADGGEQEAFLTAYRQAARFYSEHLMGEGDAG